MKRIVVLCTALLLVIGMAATGYATTITFDELTLGSSYSSLNYGNVVFTNNLGNLTVSASPGPPLSGNTILGANSWNPAEWNKATFFGVTVNQVSVDMGDYDADNDTLVLQAFNSSNAMIGSMTALNPASVYGGLTLSVATSEAIAYVLFNEQGNGNSATGYPGSAYFDNFTYNASSVPEPATLLLFGAGLLGLGAAKRKFSR